MRNIISRSKRGYITENKPNINIDYINNNKKKNSETYLTATPFWKKLSSVIKLNEDCGYINVNGKEIKLFP